MLPTLGLAAATGAASYLGGKVIQKIVGDAPMEEGGQFAMAQPVAGSPNLTTSLQQQPQQTPLGQLQRLTYENSLLRNTAYQPIQPYQQALVSATSQPNTIQDGYETKASQNILGQSASDSAALLANGIPTQHLNRMFQQGTLPATRIHNSSQIDSRYYAGNMPSQPMMSNGSSQMSLPHATLGSSNPADQITPTSNIRQPGTVTTPSEMMSEYVIVPAPQPQYKTMENQTALLPAQDMNPAMQPANTNSSQLGLANIAKGAASTVSQSIREAAMAAAQSFANQAASNVAQAGTAIINKGTAKGLSLLQTSVASAIKKIIGDAPPDTVRSLTNEIMTGTGQVDPQLMKIIGDAPMSLTRDMQPTKIVGDAPPGDPTLTEQPGMMTSDQSSAAAANASKSLSFQMLTRLIMEEQVLQVASGFIMGLNVIELNNQLTRLLTLTQGSFYQSSATIVNGIKGASVMTNRLCRYTGGSTDNPTWINDGTRPVLMLPITGAKIMATRNSPPVGGNTTFDTLRPLLLGAATTDYSSQLRVNTTTTNVDAMMRAVSAASQNLVAQTGYDFSLPLIKLIGYVLQHYPVLGEGMNTYAADANLVCANNWNDTIGAVPQATWFPLELSGRTITPHPGFDVWIGWRVCAVTEKDFIMAISGGDQIDSWEPDFSPVHWGADCAVIFIPPGAGTNRELNNARLMSQMGYPISLTEWNTEDWLWWVDRQAGVTASGGATTDGVVYPNNTVTTKAGLTRIPGPVSNILFVCLGNFSNTPMSVVFGPDNDQQVVNTVDNHPGAGGVVHEIPLATSPTGQQWPGVNPVVLLNWSTFYRGRERVTGIMSLIREWESFFGNNSNRSTALRFWADHSRMYGAVQPKVINQPTPGSPQGVTGISWVQSNLTVTDAGANLAAPSYRANFWDVMELNRLVMPATSPQSILVLGNTASGLIPTPGTLGSPGNLNTTGTAWRRIWYGDQTPDWSSDAGLVDSAVQPTITALGGQDFLVDYLMYKKWIYPMEEYPGTTLSDASRLSLTVAVMSNMMAAMTDLIVQSTNLHSTAVESPGAYQDSQTIRLLIEKRLWPAIELFMQMGIQFPTSYNTRQDLYTNTSQFRLVAYMQGYGLNYFDGIHENTLARIPRALMGQWVPAMVPIWNKLRLNLPVMRASRATVRAGNQNYNLFQVFICEDDLAVPLQAMSLVNDLQTRISQGVAVTGNSVNPGFVVRNTRDQSIRLIAFTFRYYFEYVSYYVNGSMGREGFTIPPTTNVGIPVIEKINNRDMMQGFDSNRLLSIGPIDAYGPGEGTYDYVMYYTMSSGFSAITTNTFSSVPDSVFEVDGLQSTFAAI